VSYEVFIASDCWNFLSQRKIEEHSRILFEIRRLGEDPFRSADFSDPDESGALDGIIFEQFAILYRVDHPAKRVLIADVFHADQI